jgi:hypothetical protein
MRDARCARDSRHTFVKSDSAPYEMTLIAAESAHAGKAFKTQRDS